MNENGHKRMRAILHAQTTEELQIGLVASEELRKGIQAELKSRGVKVEDFEAAMMSIADELRAERTGGTNAN